MTRSQTYSGTASFFPNPSRKKSYRQENNRDDSEKHRDHLLLRHLLLQENRAQQKRPQKTHLGDWIHDGCVAAGVHPRHEKHDAGDEYAGCEANQPVMLRRQRQFVFTNQRIQHAAGQPAERIQRRHAVDIRLMTESIFVRQSHACPKHTRQNRQRETKLRLRGVLRRRFRRAFRDERHDRHKCADDARHNGRCQRFAQKQKRADDNQNHL